MGLGMGEVLPVPVFATQSRDSAIVQAGAKFPSLQSGGRSRPFRVSLAEYAGLGMEVESPVAGTAS